MFCGGKFAFSVGGIIDVPGTLNLGVVLAAAICWAKASACCCFRFSTIRLAVSGVATKGNGGGLEGGAVVALMGRLLVT